MSITTYYATAAGLRDELTLDSAALPDDAASRLIRKAEGEVDRLIGVRPINDTTGRKVLVTDVYAWQFAKLTRATLVLAADLYNNPDAFEPSKWSRVEGPDFRFIGATFVINREAINEIDQSGLRRLSASAHGRSPGRFDAFLLTSRHGG